MDLSKKHCSLYRKGVKLKLFRLWRWLFTDGVEISLQYSSLFLVIFPVYAWKYQSALAGQLFLPCLLLYTIVLAKLILPKTGRWYHIRYQVCEKWFVNMMTDVTPVLDCPELGLTESECRFAKRYFSIHKTENGCQSGTNKPAAFSLSESPLRGSPCWRKVARFILDHF